MPIIVNQPNGKIVVSTTGAATDTITLANGDVVGTAPGANTTGYVITKILWSGNGAVTIARGANTIYTLQGSGAWDFSSMGFVDSRFSGASLVVTTVAGGSAIVEAKKLPGNIDGGR
jgi:hypothetical protein